MGSLWNRSGTVERHADDLRAGGAKAYFYLGGTTTPMTVFQDAGEGSAHPHPVVADATGRWPDIFVPYTLAYDVRVTSADDVQLTYTLSIPNPDPVDVTVTVPPSGTISTGMIHPELTSAPLAGFVRLNGLTIGNAVSNATERANADCSALFTYIWNNMPNSVAPVLDSTGTPEGRGASAAADFAANNQITLPDFQGAAAVGLANMGVDTERFSGVPFTKGNQDTPGSVIGVDGSTGYTTDNPPENANNIPRSVLVTWFIKL